MASVLIWCVCEKLIKLQTLFPFWNTCDSMVMSKRRLSSCSQLLKIITVLTTVLAKASNRGNEVSSNFGRDLPESSSFCAKSFFFFKPEQLTLAELLQKVIKGAQQMLLCVCWVTLLIHFTVPFDFYMLRVKKKSYKDNVYKLKWIDWTYCYVSVFKHNN